MAVTLTYDPVLSRVRITATALAAADTALVERSTDQVRWTTVRGGGAVGVTAGVFDLTLDDYEFVPDVANYYRVRGVETGAITFVATGATSAGNNASITPALPAGIVAGDLLLTMASIRNSGTGTVDTPAGWTVVRTAGNVTILGRRYVAGDVAPQITFTGGVANADTMGRMCAFRAAELAPVTGVDLLNPSAQDGPYSALTVPADNLLLIETFWKQDDYSSLTTRSGFTSIGGIIATGGDDAAQSWWYQIQTTAVDLAAGTHVVTGGVAAISRSMTIALEHAAYLNEQTASITPALSADCGNSAIWLKSIARPFLNQTVQVVNQPSMTLTRPARVGIFDIVGRTYPIAVSDLRGSRRWTMFVRTETAAAAQTFDFLLASGDVIFIQTPAGCTSVPSGYVAIGDTTREAHPLRPLQVTWTLPLTEVAPPGPDVVGAAITWQSVINAYASWADLLASNASWLDLLAGTASPSEVIVP